MAERQNGPRKSRFVLFARFPVVNWSPHSGAKSAYCLYEEALPKGGTFLRPQVYERVAISLGEVYTKGREICHFVYKSRKRANICILIREKVGKTFWFCDLFIFKR